MKTKVVEVKPKTIALWKTKYGEIPCCRVCGIRFKEGEVIVNRQAKHGKTKRYHKECLISEIKKKNKS